MLRKLRELFIHLVAGKKECTTKELVLASIDWMLDFFLLSELL